MKFSHFYDKLEGNHSFTTIRRYKKYKVGQIVSIYVNKDFQGNAEILKIEAKPFKEIPTSLLIEDMLPFAHSRIDCFAFLQGFYKKRIDIALDLLYIYYLNWRD